MNNPVFFGAAGDERGTPQSLFDALHQEFHFDLDAAATLANHKCELFFGDGGLATDALLEDWGGPGTTVFLNPPYSQATAFLAKARQEADNGAVIVLILPVRSDTRWWHRYIWNADDGPDGDWYPGIRTRLLPGRLQFELHVPPDLRAWIKSELTAITDTRLFAVTISSLSRVTGLPPMAIERIYLDQPDATLLDAAPFPSCVVIMTSMIAVSLLAPAPAVIDVAPEPISAPAVRLKRKYTRRGSRR